MERLEMLNQLSKKYIVHHGNLLFQALHLSKAIVAVITQIVVKPLLDLIVLSFHLRPKLEERLWP
jgi:hypothetical protein